jgi:hypothetical protein
LISDVTQQARNIGELRVAARCIYRCIVNSALKTWNGFPV